MKRIFTKEHIENMIKNHKGMSGKKHSALTKEKMKQTQIGKKHTEETKKKLRIINLGKKISEETRLKMSIAQKRIGKKPPVMFGEKNPNWKGEYTNNHEIRMSPPYFMWRKKVIERDNYTCKFCGYKSHTRIKGKSDIQADHIKPFSTYKDLRFNIDNGRTLCIWCHKKTDTFGRNDLLCNSNSLYL